MLTQSILKSLLHYEPLTGVFTWLPRVDNPPPNMRGGWGSWNTKFAGKEAGCFDGKGYRLIAIHDRPYRASRLAWLYIHGVWPDQIDHENHIRDDNRFINLRSVTNQINNQNRTLQSNNTSGIVGVSFSKRSKKWVVQFMVRGMHTCLGQFDNIEDAAVVRKAAEIEHGFHPNHGMA